MGNKLGKYDAIILGGLLGLFATMPKIAVWTTDFLNSVIPLNWFVFGSWSLPIFGIFLGIIVGAIAEKTR